MVNEATSKPAPELEPGMLETHWRRLRRNDSAALAAASAALNCNFPLAEEGFEEDEYFIYLPVTVLIREGDGLRYDRVTFAIGDRVLVTVEPEDGYHPFDRALILLKRRPELPRDAYGIMYALLQSMNSATNNVVEVSSAALEALNDEIAYIVEGFDEQGREIRTDDITDMMTQLNEREELISRIQESQLLLERAARYLRTEINGRGAALRAQIDTLISDVQGVKEHAGFEHDKVRYLQQSVMTSLNAKQNQVVKVFTIITAVFLPPTLIGTFYGMNFAVMPELSWEWGFTVTIGITLLAALLPLWYIKLKGWLR